MKSKPIAYVIVKYDLFPYCLVHKVYKWANNGNPVYAEPNCQLNRESILAILDTQRGEIASKAVDQARDNYEDIQNRARLNLGNDLIESIWELNDKISYIKGTVTHPKSK